MPRQVRFVELVERHERELHRYLFRMTGNAEDAADMFQETFLRAFRGFAGLGPEANHRAWLYRIAHRQALNLFRSRKARPSLSLDEAREIEDTASRPDSISEDRRLARTLVGIVNGLTPRQRSALLLKKYEGLPYAEVAEVLGCSADNARAHVYQAMKKVRNGLES